MRFAAKTEPNIADLLQNILKERLHNMVLLVQRLSERGPLQEGMVDLQAAETVWILTSPEVFRLLTVDRAWSKEQYIQWLVDTLTRLLLP